MPHYLGVREFRTILIRTARRGEARRGGARLVGNFLNGGMDFRVVCVCVCVLKRVYTIFRSVTMPRDLFRGASSTSRSRGGGGTHFHQSVQMIISARRITKKDKVYLLVNGRASIQFN